MKNSTPRLNAALPKDVHDALSYVLKAYSIFTPNPELPLFQAVLVNPDRDSRHKSPHWTPLNLDAIVYEATSIPEMKPPPECQAIIDILRKEVTERVDPPLNKPMRSDLANIEPEISVSVSSLVRAEVSAIVPEVNLAFGGRFSKEKRRAAKLKLTSQRSRRYSGSYLGIFLWKPGEFFFRRMLLYLHGDLGIKTGDRRILAFVTKHIHGTVSISTSEFRDTNAGVAGPVPISGCFRSTHESEESCANMGGVIGIHFIAFPVEKIGNHTWRFFRPIEIVDEENTGSDSSVRFQRASKWASGEKDTHLHNATESKEVCNEDLESTEDTQSTNSSGTESSGTSVDSYAGQDYQDVFLSGHRTDWIDVDLGESMEELAQRQVAVARHYMELNDRGKDQLILHLLESAAAAGSQAAASKFGTKLSPCSEKEVGPFILRTNLMVPTTLQGDCSMAESDREDDVICMMTGTTARRMLFWLAVLMNVLFTLGGCLKATWGFLLGSHVFMLMMDLALLTLGTIVVGNQLRRSEVMNHVSGTKGSRIAPFVSGLVAVSLTFLLYRALSSQVLLPNTSDRILLKHELAMSPNPDFGEFSDIYNESRTCSLPRFFSS